MTDFNTSSSVWDDPAFDPPRRRTSLTPTNMNVPGMFPRSLDVSRAGLGEVVRDRSNAEPAADVRDDFRLHENSIEATLARRHPSERVPKQVHFVDDSRSPSPANPAGRGYMDRSSAFSTNSTAGELSFLEWYPKGDATITYLNSEGDIESMSGLSPWIIEERCPLLAHAFEASRIGPRLHLEALNPATAKPFLRYLYTGSYALYVTGSDLFEDVPTSVLLHCQLYRLGDIYDLPDLKQQANVNVTRQCEFGCSSPEKPIDLCSAIKYVYEHLSDHTNLIETIICYCVSCFLRHQLADDFEFRAIAFDLRPFHQDLCRETMKRDFEDDTATAIIQMPFKPYSPVSYASREDLDTRRLRDVVYHFHGGEDFDSASKKRKRPELLSQNTNTGDLLLAIRAKRQEKSRGAESEALEEQLYPESGNDIRVAMLAEVDEVKEEEKALTGEEPVKVEEPSSDAEYEIVPGTSESGLNLESDSEREGLVLVQPLSSRVARETSELREQALPIRGRGGTRTLVVTNPDPDTNSDSESEWTVV